MHDCLESNRVAVVIPVYNEAQGIDKLLESINKCILKSHSNVDVFVFEDGSTDATKEVLEKLYHSENIFRFHVYMTPERKGYPKAVKDAIMSFDPSKYQFLLFMDGDGQYMMEDILKILSYSKKENPSYDIVVGCRTKRVEPFWRKFITASLRVLESILFGPPIKDVTSALRLMKTKISQDITSKVSYSKYNFWFEFTARMSMHELNVIDVPVNYVERKNGGSQVYTLPKIPKIIYSETKALFLIFYELNRNKIIKFGLVGASGACIILFFTWFLTQFLGLWYFLSALISIELSIIWAFALNTRITFQYKFRNSKHVFKGLLKYHGTALGGFIINLIVLYILTENLHIYYLSSEFVAILVAFGFNYMASTRYVWAKSLVI